MYKNGLDIVIQSIKEKQIVVFLFGQMVYQILQFFLTLSFEDYLLWKA